MNLIKKIKQAKKLNKNCVKKEEELNCFKRLNITEIPLSHGLHPDKLEKTLTDRFSSEMDRLHARILSSPIIQRTLVKMKEAKGLELTEKFLQRNERKIKQTASNRIDQEVKEKIEKSSADKKIQKEPKSKDEKKKETKSKEKSISKPGAFVKNPNFNGTTSSEDESEAEETLPKLEDPFFLSTSGDNYLATVTTAVSESSGDEEEQPPKKQFKQSKFKAGKVQKFNNGRNRKDFNSNQNNEKPKYHEKPIEVPKIIKEKPTKAPINSAEPDIHPSWAAKQQQKKLQIQEFKGTKIKFDE